jgi:DNA-binding CsgD family transcriptional regulator
MIYYLITIVFILTIAIASGSIVITSQLRMSYKSDIFSTLLFFLAFYFTFGFYAIWGQVIVTSFLSAFVTPELMQKFSDIMILLGSPFLVFASLMFFRLTREMSGRKTGRFFIVWYLLCNVLVITGAGFASFRYQLIDALTLVRYYFIALSFLYTLFGACYFIFPKKKNVKFKTSDLKNLSAGLSITMLINNTLLLLYAQSIFIALLFIFTYFLYGGLIVVYLKYKADLSKLGLNDIVSSSFEDFCRRFTITARETEIICEICRGLTNQQIADKLFISLQTVKDHTHRIYSKTDCASRAQLIRLVNDNS